MSRIVGVAIVICLLAAGCGTGSPSGATSSQTASAAALAFSKCMRAHGLANFPDPGAVTGPANTIGGVAIPASFDMQAPAFQTALHSCQGVLSGALGRHGRPPISAAVKAAIILHAQCMRTHGVPTFPDPTFPPGGGIMITDAGTNPQSPAYQHAAAVCGEG